MFPQDISSSWKVRWNIGRMTYKVKPGLYAVGSPDMTSPILVSANYKLSFDMLRKELSGLDAWVMVIDTNGINVWCAAGEGLFGTEEIINRIKKVRLSEVVSHRKIILPQLGAPGVAAHFITAVTGFKVVYGPVKAKDIKSFIDSGMKATREMRTVDFNMWDRLVLTPVEIAGTMKSMFGILAALIILNLIGKGGNVTQEILSNSLLSFIPYVGAIFIGCVIVPLLLPYIPGSAFSFKGWLAGILWALAVYVWRDSLGMSQYNILMIISIFMLLPALSSYIALNFTGCTTYTSLSGVKKEIRIVLPLILISSAAGIIMLLAGKISEII